MGIFYGKKFDIKNFFWKPRLVAASAVSAIKGIGRKNDESRKFLPMTEYPEEHGYPRPQLRRASFMSLNGMWELSRSGSQDIPTVFDDEIRVPYPPQSLRSGVKKPVGDVFWYKKRFTLTPDIVKGRVMLHFGAVDQIAVIYVNGHRAGEHEGGYLPFSFDITELLDMEGENELLVYIKDELDPVYPYGKQSKTPGGMWYTQLSGIWQSVWLESVPEERVEGVRYVYDEKRGGINLAIKGTADEYEIAVYAPVSKGEREPAGEPVLKMSAKKGRNFIPVADIRLWSPDEPWLYYFDISAGSDKVRSYFALRTIGIETVSGKKRICLNHKPYFFHGVLDQGYFSDGIYTPVSDRYFEKDILLMKELGFNTLRKHIKIEPAVFYYDCDRLGMVVFQDMVNNGSYNYLRDTIMPTVFPFYVGHFKKDTNFKVDKRIRSFFVKHSKDTVRYLHNFPSVLCYTIFNEGWGQFNADRVFEILKKVDPTRIYDSASGWYKQKKSDVESIHVYFHKVPISRWKKPMIVSEFGGFSYCVEKNSSFKSRIYGYGLHHSKRSLTDRIVDMYEEEIIPHIHLGLCGSIYTQLSDVEEEINGLYTYDRLVCKVEKERLRAVSEKIRKTVDAL